MNADACSTIRNKEMEHVKTPCRSAERAEIIFSLQSLLWELEDGFEEQR